MTELQIEQKLNDIQGDVKRIATSKKVQMGIWIFFCVLVLVLVAVIVFRPKDKPVADNAQIDERVRLRDSLDVAKERHIESLEDEMSRLREEKAAWKANEQKYINAIAENQRRLNALISKYENASTDAKSINNKDDLRGSALGH